MCRNDNMKEFTLRRIMSQRRFFAFPLGLYLLAGLSGIAADTGITNKPVVTAKNAATATNEVLSLAEMVKEFETEAGETGPHAEAVKTLRKFLLGTAAEKEAAEPPAPEGADKNPPSTAPGSGPARPATVSDPIASASTSTPPVQVDTAPVPALPERTFDSKTPLEAVREAAKSNDPAAQVELARRLLSGEARSPEATRVLETQEREVRVLYGITGNFEGSGGKEREAACVAAAKRANELKAHIEAKELGEALKLINAAIVQTNTDAMVLFSSLLTGGTRIAKNLDLAFEMSLKAAKLGHRAGMQNIGVKYARGEGVKKDMKEAVRWLGKSCERGDLTACSNLGDILADGGLGQDAGYPKNLERAYTLGRAFQLLAQPSSTAYAWGSRIVERVSARLTPEQLLDAEAEAEKEMERLKADNGMTPKGPGGGLVSAADMTKRQWRQSLGKAARGALVSKRDSVVVLGPDALVSTRDGMEKYLGKPVRTRSVGEDEYWYYECADGTIEVHILNTNQSDNQLTVLGVDDY